MILETIVVGPLETNCYIFGDEETKEIMVVDPGQNGKMILNHISEKGYILKYVVLTHGHFDHIMGMNPLLSVPGVKLLAHKEDVYKIFEPQSGYLPRFGNPDYTPKEPDIYLEDNKSFKVGNLDVLVLHTPGHTKGGCCLLSEDVMFSGDTVFYHEIGRCDLEGGDYSIMLKSLKKLKELPTDYKIYPGHGPSTTLFDEKKMNPYMQEV